MFAGRNRFAVVAMMAATTVFSLAPLAFDFLDASQRPFLFNAGWRVGCFLGILAFLLARWPNLLADSAVRATVARSALRWSFLWIVAGKFEFALFALAVRFLDIALAAVLFETWPLLMVLLLARDSRRDGRWRGVGLVGGLALALGYAGAALVVASQGVGLPSWSGLSSFGFYAGVLMVLGASFLAGFGNGVLTFRWGALLARRLPDSGATELFGALIAGVLSMPAGELGSVVLGLVAGESWSGTVFVLAAVCGCFYFLCGTLLWIASNLRSADPSINAMVYVAPVLSVVALLVLGRSDVDRPVWLLAGALAVALSSALIFVRRQVPGFGSLWLRGVNRFVFRRPG